MPYQRKSPIQIGAGWGGARPGAGRKPNDPVAGPGVSHGSRPPIASRYPVHVTHKVREHIPDLRDPQIFTLVLDCLREGQKYHGFRIVHFSIQNRAIHVIVEALDAVALSRGIQALSVRIARRINKQLGTTGKVFADRYNLRVLKTPSETRKALAYVINNMRRHQGQLGKKLTRGWIDPLSSGVYFDGWKDAKLLEGEDGDQLRDQGEVKRVGLPPKTWLLKTGWKLRGLLSVNEVPTDEEIPQGSAKTR